MLEEDLNPNVNFSEILKGRLITSTFDFTMSDVEKSFLKDIFEKNPKIKHEFKKIDSIELLDRNFFYDIYRFKCEGKGYCLKLGDRHDNYIFKREYSFLDKIKEKKISPRPILNGRGKDYSYLITTYEFSESIKQLGISFLISNIKLFSKTLKDIHESSKTESSEKEMFIDMYISMGAFNEILDQKQLNALRSFGNFEKCEQILKGLEDTIKIQVPSMVEQDPCICHMNLTESNILYRGGLFKLCNFHKSFNLNPLWDLAMTSLNLGFNSHPKLEEKFIKHYSKENMHHIKNILPAYKDVCYKLILYEIICVYFYKIIITKEDRSLESLFFAYETIRPLILNEFPMYTKILDPMFGDFNKI